MARRSKKTAGNGTKDERFRDIAQNRRARFEYEILERVEAGLVLQGTEVKGLRDHGATIGEAYVVIRDGEAWLVGANIPEYANAGMSGHLPDRTRKLLMHRREIERFADRLREKGLALVPLRLYFKEGRAKVEVGLGRGKSVHDKRQTIIKRETDRDLARANKRG
ncbi:MAG: SsrA-binding protein SmpB [Actinobacteria bacterium]|nr:SsrA-binding protein SmpB [Thermoleophilia bacterium]MCB9010542.1 SsrA-binding protein SmpB [Actinomycetota bacterium]